MVLIAMLTAFVLDQERVEDCPAVMVNGLAEIVQVTGSGADGVTSRPMEQFAVPPRPVTVAVYVVLVVGKTLLEPLAIGIIELTP